MYPDARIMNEIAPYQPWLIIGAVFVLFFLLRVTRRGLRQRVDEIGYWLMGSRGRLIWFWLNAPGVILHEMSHALAILLFYPFGFRVTSITFFRVQPKVQQQVNGRISRGGGGRQSLQLGEVQYVRPQGRLMSYIGDGFSGIAPLFGGIVALAFLYWVATGYSLWDLPFEIHNHIQMLRPGCPWWTLLFAPYLILTVTSELWPSHQDWHEARWFVGTLCLLLAALIFALWYTHRLQEMLPVSIFIASHINFALLVLLVLDLFFLIVAEIFVQALRH
jgi:hypothetical protein